MTFNDLHYISVIASEKSITKAADKLYMSQPALSQYLKKVEKELGIWIFERTPAGVLPTEEGLLFLAFVKKALQDERELQKQLQNLRDGDTSVGTVYLGFTGTQATYVLPYILPDFHLKYPKIEIVLVEGTSDEIEKEILQHTVDIGILHPPLKESGLDCFELSRDDMVVVPRVNSSYQQYVYWGEDQKPYINMEYLRDEPLVLTHPDMRSRMVCDSIFKNAGFTPTIKLISKRLDTLNALAKVGFSSTIMPLKQLSPELREQDYYFIDPKYNVPYSFVVAVRKNAYVSKPVQKLIDELRLKQYTF